MIRLGVLGISGKMGARVESLIQDPKYKAKILIHAKPKRNEDFKTLQECNVILDFSSPEAVLFLLASGIKRPVLIGSTGWTAEQRQALEKHVVDHSLFLIPNFSLGISAIRSVLRLFKDTGIMNRYSVRMREEHHAQKKDAPSGTALSLAKELPDQTPIESIRAGNTIGTHEMIFESAFERIEIRHEALSRDLFASGAIESAIALAESSGKFLGRIHTLEDLF